MKRKPPRSSEASLRVAYHAAKTLDAKFLSTARNEIASRRDRPIVVARRAAFELPGKRIPIELHDPRHQKNIRDALRRKEDAARWIEQLKARRR